MCSIENLNEGGGSLFFIELIPNESISTIFYRVHAFMYNKVTKEKEEDAARIKFRIFFSCFFLFCVFFLSHSEIPESRIEVVGRSHIKPTYREIAKAFELEFDFANL
jgi:hypothetical protein